MKKILFLVLVLISLTAWGQGVNQGFTPITDLDPTNELDNETAIVSDYSSLSTFTGNENTVIITDDGVAGTFVRDETATVADGGLVPVVGWRRIFDGPVHAAWFGVSPSNLDNAAALTAAAFSSLRNDLLLPEGVLRFSSEVVIPNNVNMYGFGRGFGVNYKTRLQYEGNGVAIRLAGYYVNLKGIHLYTEVADNSSIGVLYEGTRTSLEDMTIQGFGQAGVANRKFATTFTHLHEKVYIHNCGIGIDFEKVNNAVFSKCYIESCTELSVLKACTNVVFDSGTVFETFGDGRFREADSTKCIIAQDVNSLTVRDCYIELSSLAPEPLTVKQCFATLDSVNGFVFEGNYSVVSASSAQIPMIIPLSNKVTGVRIANNSFLRMGTNTEVWGDTTTSNLFREAIALADVSANSLRTDAYQLDRSWEAEITVSGASEAGMTYSANNCNFYTSGGVTSLTGKITISGLPSTNGYLSLEGFPVRAANRLGGESEFRGVVTIETGALEISTPVYLMMESAGNTARIYYGNRKSLFVDQLAVGVTLSFNISYPNYHEFN